MHQLERKILRLSIIVLFLSLLVVYALFYQVKWTKITNNVWSYNDDNLTKIYVKSGDDKKLVGSISLNKTGSLDTELLRNDDIINKSITGNWKTITWNDLVKIVNNKQSIEIKYLSWTQLFYWVLESIEKLWIPYKYILQDNKWIYYAYLGDFNYDIVNIARKLWWNIYTINTEQEILKNQLFWNKVMFINLAEYKNKKVLMLVYIWKEARLIQVDYKLYHKSKTYLQSLFID